MKSLFRAGVLLLILGVSFSAYLNVGMWFEREHTDMHNFRAGLKGASEQVGMSTFPDPTLRHLLSWSNFRFWLIPPEPPHWYGGYLGISLCVLALAGVGIAFFQRNKLRHFIASWACLLLSAPGHLCLPSAPVQYAVAHPCLQLIPLSALSRVLSRTRSGYRYTYAFTAPPRTALAKPLFYPLVSSIVDRSLPHHFPACL